MPTTGTGQHEIVIDAPIEAVWKAISDGEELTRWFVEEATRRAWRRRHDLHFVGRRGDEARARSTRGSRTGSCGRSWHAVRDGRGEVRPAVPMVDEYTIERRDGKTVLRLVCSGIPDAPEWDGFYNGTDTGWALVLPHAAPLSRTSRAASRARRSRSSASCPARSRTPGRVCWPRSSRQAPSSSNRRPTILEVSDSRARRRLPLAHDVGRRSEQVRLHDAVGLRKNAGRGRNDPREMAAVARAGLGVEGGSDAAATIVGTVMSRHTGFARSPAARRQGPGRSCSGAWSACRARSSILSRQRIRPREVLAPVRSLLVPGVRLRARLRLALERRHHDRLRRGQGRRSRTSTPTSGSSSPAARATRRARRRRRSPTSCERLGRDAGAARLREPHLGQGRQRRRPGRLPALSPHVLLHRRPATGASCSRA